jgi:hypothetical protein
VRAMRVVSIGICVSACALFSAFAADNGTPLKVKPGLWEITSEGQNSGTPPIPPEALANLTPAQRAQMEARIKEAMSQGAQRRVVKRCVTQQEIDQGFDKLNQMSQGQCTQTITSSSATLREGRLQCTGATTASGVYRFEAPSPERVNGSWDMTMSDASHSMKVKNTLQGKWLGADCGNIKPGEN